MGCFSGESPFEDMSAEEIEIDGLRREILWLEMQLSKKKHRL